MCVRPSVLRMGEGGVWKKSGEVELEIFGSKSCLDFIS